MVFVVVTVYLLLLLIFSAIGKRKFGNWINLINVFTCIWCFFGGLSELGLYGLRIPSIRIHIYAWIFISTVNVVFFSSYKKRNRGLRRNISLKIDVQSAYIIQIIGVILYCPTFAKILPGLLSGGILAARNLYYGKLYSSYYASFVFLDLPGAIFSGLCIYFVYVSLQNRNMKYIKYALLNVLLPTLVVGGRYPLLLFAVACFMCYVLNLNHGVRKSYQYRRLKSKTRKLIILAVVIIISMSIIRQGVFVRNIVIYFSGSLSFLDLIVENPGKFALNEKLYGYLTFSTFWEPVVLVFKALGLTTEEVPSFYFNSVCQPFQDIGMQSTIWFNSNTSVLYYFLRDFGVLGIPLGGFLFGKITAYFYKQYLRLRSPFSGCMLIYLSNALFTSIMTYRIFSYGPLFVTLVLYYCTKTYQIQEEDNRYE